MAKRKKNHYSPVLANKRWCDPTSHYWTYEKDVYSGEIEGKTKGREQWGFQERLYSADVETALGRELEGRIEPIYSKFLVLENIVEPERLLWAQFLRSQFVRTPTFIRYEKMACSLLGGEERPVHDRVGCKDCLDLGCVTSRDWMLLVAHKDDYFVRTDNPVYLTGFLEDRETVLYYPLTPKICFVACSMSADWTPFDVKEMPLVTPAYQIGKGGAHVINFNVAKAADRSLIIHPDHKGVVSDTMFKDVLGVFPQIPFDLHHLEPGREEEILKSLVAIMSVTDGRTYPHYDPSEMGPRFA